MIVCIEPPAHMSQAMFRVARALARYAPAEITITRKAEEADFHVLHVIGQDAIPYIHERPDLRYAIIQYCLKTAGGATAEWQSVWQRASLVWSYYDLPLPERLFYYAPLGVDGTVFVGNDGARTTGVMTSGYVTGPGAEAIEEITLAAARHGLPVVHLGPVPVSDTGLMTTPAGWRSIDGVSDHVLAEAYSQSYWVSGLRHVEGFELPAAEGLLCGARPIVFDRPEMLRWYAGHAVFVPECSGAELVEVLSDVLAHRPIAVSKIERQIALRTFDWEVIARGFWAKLQENV